MVWMDVLDVGMVQLMDAQFLENAPEAMQQTPRSGDDNMALFGNTMKPLEHQPRSHTSPLVWYPYERTRDALHTMQAGHAVNACWGHKLQYTNPVTGGWAMPTIGTFMQLLPKGFRGKAYRSTDSTIYTAVEGKGRCKIAGKTLEFGPKDVFVCPSWMPYTLEADADTVLFSASDRPAQQAMDLWREAF
jgi:gentisate 1,2-dioxygenase